MTTDKERESERFDQWWKTQDWDGAYMDVAWDAWWEAVRDATDEEIIEVLLPDQEQKAEISRLQKQVAGMRATLEDFANPDHWNQNDDGEWIWHGYYPPFERPTVDLLGTLGATP